MSTMQTKNALLLLLAIAVLWAPALVRAGASLLPVVPEAQRRVSETQGCVEPTEDMRKNHMKYLLHHRDQTVHEGIRTKQFSLEECIDCHVSPAPDAPRISSSQHFCNSCHTYAAVNIDCFECHADRPAPAAAHQSVTPASPSAGQHADATDANSVASPAGSGRQLASEESNHD
jgi:hypothetical protein